MAGEPGQYWAEQMGSYEPGVWALPVGGKSAMVNDLVPGVVDAADLKVPCTRVGAARPHVVQHPLKLRSGRTSPFTVQGQGQQRARWSAGARVELAGPST